jgi:hypothetical protein
LWLIRFAERLGEGRHFAQFHVNINLGTQGTIDPRETSCLARFPRILAVAALFVLTFCLAALPLAAQSTSGIISGSVADQQGQPLPGATVTIADPAKGLSYPANVDESGRYRLPEVPPGTYDVTAEKPGFQTVRHISVVVSLGNVTIEDFLLKIAGPSTTIVVQSSTAPMLQTSDSTLRSSFSETQIQELPLLTRDVNNLALLAPGVVSVRTFSFASTLVPFSVNGSRGRDNNFVIDSVDNNEPLFGGAATQFTNTDIFSDFTILTHQQEAEYGNNTGATVNVITRSGSNGIHGSAFWFGQNGVFNALSAADAAAGLTSPPSSYENQSGVALGGPIKRDRTFFFVSYQSDLAGDNLTEVYPVLSTLPTTAGLATLAMLRTTPALNSLLNVSTVAKVPSYYSSPCFQAPAPAGFNTQNPCLPASGMVTPGVQFNVFNIPNANQFNLNDNQFSGRVDHRISAANEVYGRYLFDNLTVPSVPLSTAGDSAFYDLGLYPQSALFQQQRTQSLLVDERYSRPNALNEVRFSFSRIAQATGPFNEPTAVQQTQPAATVYDQFCNFGAFANNFPSACNNFTIGQDSRPTSLESNIYQAQDNYSYIHGRHRLKFGADLTATDANLLSVPEDLGHYAFGNLGEAGGFNSFVAGQSPTVAFQRLPNLQVNSAGMATGMGPETLSVLPYDLGIFAQDDFQVTRHLNLNVGLRYEYLGQPINRMRESNANVPHVSTPQDNLGPRVGFAWSPINNFVVRGGYGIMYNPEILDIPLLIWQGGLVSPFVASLVGPNEVGSPDTVLQPSGTFPNSPFSIASLNSATVASCGPYNSGGTVVSGLTVKGTVPVTNCSNQDTVSPTLRNPYTQNYSLGVQYELPGSWLVSVGWVGSKGTKLFLRQDLNPFQGWNQPCLNNGGNINDIACLNPRTNSNSGDVTSVTNQGDSTYNSLQLSATKRYSALRAGRLPLGNMLVTSTYTWSHFIDNASEIFGPGVQFLGNEGFEAAFSQPRTNGLQPVEAITPFAQNPLNLAAEKGNSSFDRRQRLAISYVWDPYPNGGRWLGGWQFNGIITAQSGQPFSPLNGNPNGFCADAFGQGQLTNDRPAIGNPNAPAGSVALLNDPNCVNTSLGYTVYLNGQVAGTDPAAARFVQEPVGTSPGQPFTVGNATFIAGSAGRNILVGPGLAEGDAALLKNFKVTETKTLQLRWEVYDVVNHPNSGFPLGNIYATNAQPTPAYAFSTTATPAAVTGVIPENSIDAISGVCTAAGTCRHTFLTTQYMNTGNRTMQFGAKFIF